MNPVKERINVLLAQAKGTRWDVVAARVCGILSVTAGLAPYAGIIPGRTGAMVAGIAGGAAALLPRATKAAGLLQAAYNQQTPLLKVLPALVQTLLTAPQIAADARTQASAQAAADRAAEKAALIREAVDAVEARFKTGAYTAGTGPGNLSQSVASGDDQSAGKPAEEKLAEEKLAEDQPAIAATGGTQ